MQLTVKDTREIEEGVIKNEFDFGFVGGHLAGDEVEVLPWLTDEIVLIAPVNHRLAGKRIVTTAGSPEREIHPSGGRFCDSGCSRQPSAREQH